MSDDECRDTRVMTIRRRLLATLASAVIAAAPMLRAPVLHAPMAWLPAVAGAVVLSGTASDAWAQSRGRSSGGYSRPSAPRTPSFSASPSTPRTPSSSGGYARPSPSGPSAMPFSGAAPSAGDQALSRQRAADALQQQRAQEQRRQEAARPAPQPAPQPTRQPAPSTGGGLWAGSTQRTPSYAPPPPPRGSSWFAQQGWSAPSYAAAAPRSFGVWNGLMLWFMLDNLIKPGYSDFFRSRRDDPGIQQWRQQADGLAQDNPDLRRKLAELDSRTAPGATPDSGWVEVPSDIPPEIAAADTGPKRTPSTAAGLPSQTGIGAGGIVFGIVLLAGAGGLAYMALRRRRGTDGRVAQGDTEMNPLKSAIAMARNAVAPAPYVASHFRVGMVLTVDLSPFILAAGATKVVPPDASADGRVTVAAVGRLDAAGLVRLHLDDRKGLFQLHLDAKGTPDECRYFSLIEEVAPADAGEWDVWLNPAEGMIGWPEFQTKDGKTYQRVWSPGGSRIAPVAVEETITTAEGSETIRQQAMLYGAPTGLAAPAPVTEYILVSAIERGGQAWVELRAGIDINPATLELT